MAIEIRIDNFDPEKWVEIQGENIRNSLEQFGRNVFSQLEPAVRTLEDVRVVVAINGDLPTTASALPGILDIPTIEIQVDPEGKSSIFPNAIKNIAKLNIMLSSFVQSSRNDVIYNSLTNALRILINRYSFDEVIKELKGALYPGGIQQIDSNFRDIVRKSISDILLDLSNYGVDNIPDVKYRTIEKADFNSTPDNIVSVVPNLYTQNYYKYVEDLYPGYQEWQSKDGTKTVYLKRKIGDYYFETLDEEIKGNSEKRLADKIGPYVTSVDLKLTASLLNTFLNEEEVLIKEDGMEKALGKNSALDFLSVLADLIGQIAATVDSQKNDQLPNSVLNQNSISNSLDKFSENMAMMKKMNELIDQAMVLPNVIETLANQNISNILSSLNIPSISVSFEGAVLELNTTQIQQIVSGVEETSRELVDNLLKLTVEIK